MSTSTRISSIQCEGNHGEVLKLTSKHTIQLPAGVTEAAPASKDERAASILPPPNALVSLTLQVRVDRKLVPVHDLQRSGLLETVVAFLTKVSRSGGLNTLAGLIFLLLFPAVWNTS